MLVEFSEQALTIGPLVQSVTTPKRLRWSPFSGGHHKLYLSVNGQNNRVFQFIYERDDKIFWFSDCIGVNGQVLAQNALYVNWVKYDVTKPLPPMADYLPAAARQLIGLFWHLTNPKADLKPIAAKG